MEKTAYEYKIFRQDAILSPEQFYPEKFSQGVVYIETESLQRRPHLVGMTTRRPYLRVHSALWQYRHLPT